MENKKVDLKFGAGDTVFLLHNNKITETTIRTVSYEASVEIQKDATTRTETRKKVERINYSTFADPNRSMHPDHLFASREDLIKSMSLDSSKKSDPTPPPPPGDGDNTGTVSTDSGEQEKKNK